MYIRERILYLSYCTKKCGVFIWLSDEGIISSRVQSQNYIE